jgi:hypothetical protein
LPVREYTANNEDYRKTQKVCAREPTTSVCYLQGLANIESTRILVLPHLVQTRMSLESGRLLLGLNCIL